MKAPNILRTKGNLTVLRREIEHILTVKSKKAFDAEIKKNITQLLELGRYHQNFAKKLPETDWRQKVSRAYYGAYSISKAVRLAIYGTYSTEVKDHDKVGDFPEDFPDLNTYRNKLKLLRDDRNLCDYDHTAEITDLTFLVSDSLSTVDQFLSDALSYLQLRGYKIR